MRTRTRGRSEAVGTKSGDPSGPVPWPVWARVAVSAGLMFHFGAVLGGGARSAAVVASGAVGGGCFQALS